MKYTTRTTCRVCGSSSLVPLFSLGNQYVSDFVTQDKVWSGPRCPIDIELCTNCTLVQSKHTAPQDFLYSRHYWYRSGVTETMRRALRDVAESAVRKVALEKSDVVIDIGSNDGTLLKQFQRMNFLDLNLVGIEPATNMVKDYVDSGIVMINEFWDASKYEFWADRCCQSRKAKIITACGMFYDLEDPNQFIADVAKVLHPEGVFVAQLMCLKQTIENYDIGNFAHEHLEFYSLKALATLFEKHGLRIHGIEENDVNGGSYRVFAKHRDKHPLQPRASNGMVEFRPFFTKEWEMGLDKPETYRGWFNTLETRRKKLHSFISDEAVKGKRTWVYGASTKGNVILQYCGLDDKLVHGAADRSPEKWWKFTAGTGIPIVSEASARCVLPDYFLVLPYAFLPEFIEREKDEQWRKKGGKFIVPLPEFKVV